MAEPTRLRYHRAVFEMRRLEPELSGEASRQIEEAERASGRPLPAAVREWYALANAPRLFGCYLTPRERLLGLWRGELTPGPGDRPGHVALAGDGGDGDYFVALGPDDPPVFTENPTVYDDDQMHLQADSFSAWVFAGAWPRRPDLLLAGNDPTFGPMHLDYLKERFNEGPCVRAGAGAAWFFYAGGARFCVALVEGRAQATSCQASGDTEADLLEVVGVLRGCGEVVRHLRPVGGIAGQLGERLRPLLTPSPPGLS
jgi:hypothetical protein